MGVDGVLWDLIRLPGGDFLLPGDGVMEPPCSILLVQLPVLGWMRNTKRLRCPTCILFENWVSDARFVNKFDRRCTFSVAGYYFI